MTETRIANAKEWSLIAAGYKSKADGLAKALHKSILTIQWVTNNYKMSPAQHVKLGDQIVEINDVLLEYRGEL